MITNRYLENNDNKEKTNVAVQKADCANKYWARNDYDILQGKYCDEGKEVEFVSKRNQEAAVHGKNEVKKLPITVQLDGLMYNPLNMAIEDPERLKEKDQREWNKKARYCIRYEAEQATRDECLAE